MTEYLNNTNLSKRTISEYIARHKKLEAIFAQSLDLVVNLPKEQILERLATQSENQKYLCISYLLTYCKHHNVLRDDLQELLSTLREQKPKSEPKKSLDLDQDLAAKLNSIDDMEAKCMLTLLVKYPVLRSDYNTILIKNFKIGADNIYLNGSIHFETLVKVENKVIIDLKPEDQELFDSFVSTITDRDYLFHLQNSSSFCKWIKQISIKYFNKDYTISDYRKLYPSKELAKCKTVKEFVDTQKEIAKAQNHSVPVQNQYYLQSKEFENEILLEIGDKKIKITGTNLKITFI